LLVLVAIIICSRAIEKGVSPLAILYGSAVVFLIMAI